jgi:hypothetical protein
MGMEPTCKLFERTKNLKSFMTTKLAKAGEGAGLAKVRQGKKRKRVESRAEAKQDDIESERTAMQNSELLLCDACCPRTGMYCRKVYLEEKGLQVHLANHDDAHDFPAGENARDFVLREASKPGGLVEAGSRPDRQKNDELFENIVASESGCRGEEDAWCFGLLNRNENTIPYWKPPKLVEVLEELYNMEPKLRACEMREHMRRMKDDDGGLLFCYSKKYTTGMLLSEDQIQSWISSRTQRKKKTTKGVRRKKDLVEDEMIEEVEKA